MPIPRRAPNGPPPHRPPPPDRADRGAAAVFTPGQRLALLAGCALLVMLRLPLAWAQGRFLGEEGTIFFAYAWHHPAADALWRSFGGYLNIAANAATLLAARLARGGPLPLADAPYLTMGIALLFQLVPAILILTARGRWLASRPAVAAALLLLAVAPRTEEVFFNVLHIQFHLALAAGIVLAADVPEGRRARAAYGAILFAAPLCGPGAIVLAPFFALRALVERDRARLAQTAMLGAGAAIQLLVFFQPSPVRGEMLHPAALGAILFVRLLALPVLVWKPGRIGNWVHASYVADTPGWWLAAAAALVWFAGLALLALRDRRDPAAWLIVPGLAVGAVSFGGGMIQVGPHEWFSVGAGERYNFLPLVLIGLGLIALARRPARRYPRYCAALVGLALLAGAIGYARPVGELARGPAWRGEVARWRADHAYPLATWPAGWTVDLTDGPAPLCRPPVRAGATASADPGYCESNWLARVERDARRSRMAH